MSAVRFLGSDLGVKVRGILADRRWILRDVHGLKLSQNRVRSGVSGAHGMEEVGVRIPLAPPLRNPF